MDFAAELTLQTAAGHYFFMNNAAIVTQNCALSPSAMLSLFRAVLRYDTRCYVNVRSKS